MVLLAISLAMFAISTADISLTLRFALKGLIVTITAPFDINADSGASIESGVKYQLYITNK